MGQTGPRVLTDDHLLNAIVETAVAYRISKEKTANMVAATAKFLSGKE